MKSREIGSEFWDIPILDKNNFFFPANTTWHLSGRSAQKAILSHIKSKHNVKTAAVPSWCCDSMIVPFVKAGIEVFFYPVYIQNGKLTRDVSSTQECDILFTLDYFGYSESESYDNYPGIVIRDLTHSVFSKEHKDAAYTFGSLRKWAGFWTGGFATGFSDSCRNTDEEYVSIRRFAMEQKAKYISGASDCKNYLSDIARGEEHLDSYPSAGADERDIGMAHRLNISFIKEKRRKNASVLLQELSDMAIFPELTDHDCPLFVPIMVPDGKRDSLRRYLIEKEIYCPIHWALTKYHKPDNLTKELFDNELSLVCDQRYDEDDMHRIIKTIKEF